MLSTARSAAVVLSGNRMLYNFGPGGPTFKWIGGGAMLGIANPRLSYPVLSPIVLTAFW